MKRNLRPSKWMASAVIFSVFIAAGQALSEPPRRSASVAALDEIRICDSLWNAKAYSATARRDSTFPNGSQVVMYSAKSPVEGSGGYWVGFVENMGPKAVDLTRKARLGPGAKACLWVPGTSTGSTALLASITPPGRGNVDRLDFLKCKHPANHAGDPEPPRFLASANKCADSLTAVVSRKGKVESLTIGSATAVVLGQMLMRAQAERPLNEELRELLALLETPGTWFPCASYGCCRAF